MKNKFVLSISLRLSVVFFSSLLYSGVVAQAADGDNLFLFLTPILSARSLHVASCDTNHVDQCTTQATCFAVGGYWWSENTCNGNMENPDFGTVVSAGQVWMDRNLGAPKIAESSWDGQAYGDLYQWGRSADGHQKRVSMTTSILSTSDNPGHGNFIVVNGANWRTPQNDSLWQGVSGVNNPCPSGFRLPTEIELKKEHHSWIDPNVHGGVQGQFASPLKLVGSGVRQGSNGELYAPGSEAAYWTSTVQGNKTRALWRYSSTDFDTDVYSVSGYWNSYDRSNGFSVRCIKD